MEQLKKKFKKSEWNENIIQTQERSDVLSLSEL